MLALFEENKYAHWKRDWDVLGAIRDPQDVMDLLVDMLRRQYIDHTHEISVIYHNPATIGEDRVEPETYLVYLNGRGRRLFDGIDWSDPKARIKFILD